MKLLLLAVLLAATPVEDHVVDLPQDQNRWYLTVVKEPGQSVPNLDWLKSQTNYNEYSPTDPLYVARLSKSFGSDLPCVRLQRAAKGNVAKVVYEAKGKDIRSGADISSEIALAIQQCGPEPEDEIPTIRPTSPLPVPPNVLLYVGVAIILYLIWRSREDAES